MRSPRFKTTSPTPRRRLLTDVPFLLPRSRIRSSPLVEQKHAVITAHKIVVDNEVTVRFAADHEFARR